MPDDPNADNTERISDKSQGKQIQDLRDRIKRGEKFMIFFTGAIAFFAFGSLVLGLLQWHVMNGQLKEMHGGSADTHTLAEQAKVQAAAAANIADTAKQSASDTLAQMKAQSEAMQGAAGAAKIQAETSKRALDETIKIASLDQRPWIGIVGNVELISERVVTPDLVIVNIKFLLENYGKSPARRVYAEFGLDHSYTGVPSRWTSPDVCKVPDIKSASRNPDDMADSIFPGPDGTVSKATDATNNPGQTDASIKPTWLIGCISYQDTGNVLHHTKVLYYGARDEDESHATPVPDNPRIKYIKILGWTLSDVESD